LSEARPHHEGPTKLEEDQELAGYLVLSMFVFCEIFYS
jgi:hypothetical protein